MSKREIGSTIETARQLVGHLPRELDEKLKLLVLRAENGQDTTREIIKLLSRYENIRYLMSQQIELRSGQDVTKREYGPSTGSSSAGYISLAGWPDSIPASKKWICQEPTCDHWMLVIQAGEDAPRCVIHNTPMVHERK